MFDTLINDIRKPHDVEAAVGELIHGITGELSAVNGDTNKLNEMVGWLHDHQTEIAYAISTEETHTAAPTRRKSRHHP